MDKIDPRDKKVEDWMKQDDAITSGPREYFSFGMSIEIDSIG